MLYTCQNCTSNRSFRTLHALLVHIRIRHAHEPDFSVTCGLNQCQQQYKSYCSYRKHISRKHADFLGGSLLGHNGSEDESVDIETGDVHDSSVSDTESIGVSQTSSERLQEIESEFSQSLARFVLKFREEHNIAISVQNKITSEMKSMVETYQHEISTEIKRHLVSKGYDVGGDAALCDLLDSDKQLNDAFTNVSSEYMLKMFCKSSLNFISPHAIPLENKQFHFVSVCDVVTALLQNDDVLEKWDSDQRSDDGYLRDYCDGVYFKEHPLFSTCPQSVRLHLYIDEFEVANPIGANRGKHKMTAIYFTVGNLPPIFRSQQKFIFLTLLARHTLVKEHKYDVILAPLIEDLKKLETVGITDKYGKVYKGAIATISADNLSAHAVAGFRQSFSSGRICRFCMACKDNIADKFFEEDFTIRSEQIHDYHVQEVTANPDNKSIYGVSGKCPFSDLTYFSVTKCFPVDIMHDCLEGVIPFVLELILNRLHEGNSHLYDDINKIMASFAYSEHDKLTRPPAIRSNGTIIGSASQKWCMFRLFPFFLPEIPVTDNIWELYCLLREITAIVFSPVVHATSLGYLELLITEHHTLLRSLFPDGRFPAKLHYMIHYPRLISLLGPLRNLWCMRFESKHLYFKRVAVACHNFINITHTTRHQFLQCYQMSGPELFGKDCELPQTGSTVEMKNLPYSLRKLIPDKYSALWEVSRCKVQQVQYARKQVILMDYIHGEDIPVFVILNRILYAADEECFYFCGHILQAVSFSTDYQAFEVVQSDWVVFHPGDERLSLGMNMYRANDASYVIMQYSCLP